MLTILVHQSPNLAPSSSKIIFLFCVANCNHFLVLWALILPMAYIWSSVLWGIHCWCTILDLISLWIWCIYFSLTGNPYCLVNSTLTTDLGKCLCKQICYDTPPGMNQCWTGIPFFLRPFGYLSWVIHFFFWYH